MNKSRGPAVVLGLLYIGLMGFMVSSASQLPARVATHFDFQGHPNGWMSRSGHLTFMWILGTILPLLPVVILYLTRSLPPGLINVPNRDYWLAPERRQETLAYLMRLGIWAGCIIIGFVASVHYLILRANSQATIQLATPLLLTLLGLFLAALIAWTVGMIRHFRRVPVAPAVTPSRA